MNHNKLISVTSILLITKSPIYIYILKSFSPHNMSYHFWLIDLFLEDSKISYMDHIFLLQFLAKVHYYQNNYIDNQVY